MNGFVQTYELSWVGKIGGIMLIIGLLISVPLYFITGSWFGVVIAGSGFALMMLDAVFMNVCS